MGRLTSQQLTADGRTLRDRTYAYRADGYLGRGEPPGRLRHPGRHPVGLHLRPVGAAHRQAPHGRRRPHGRALRPLHLGRHPARRTDGHRPPHHHHLGLRGPPPPDPAGAPHRPRQRSAGRGRLTVLHDRYGPGGRAQRTRRRTGRDRLARPVHRMGRHRLEPGRGRLHPPALPRAVRRLRDRIPLQLPAPLRPRHRTPRQPRPARSRPRAQPRRVRHQPAHPHGPRDPYGRRGPP